MSPTKKRALNIGLCITILGGAVMVGRSLAAIGSNRDGVRVNREAIDSHETRIDGIQEVVTATQTDVEWIRETMEKAHP
jgi:hypothetical protein